MLVQEILDLMMFASACVFLLCGFPVAFTLAGTALLYALIGLGFGIFDMSLFGAMASRIYGTMTNEVLIAVPLFVFMGVMLERSKVAEELLETMGAAFGSMRGGIGLSVTFVGALLAASTGIVGATVVTMGLLSLPTMLRRGYNPSLACGSICAAGTLGQIIPPSIVLVLLGDQLSIAYQKAQLSQGIFSPETVSVGDLFAGALLPGLMLVGMYVVYQLTVALLLPSTSPAIPREELDAAHDEEALILRVLSALVPPIVLIIAVLGSILAGVATPTEAAAVGAIGSLMLAGLRLDKISDEPITQPKNALVVMRPFYALAERMDRGGPWPIYISAISLVIMLVIANTMDLRVKRDEIPTADMIAIVGAVITCLIFMWGMSIALWRVFATRILQATTIGTMKVSSMVFVILIGAAVFSLVFRGLGGDDAVHEFLSNLPGGQATAIVMVMLVMFFLGFFLDFIEITFVVVPLVAPILLAMEGVDPVWLGIMMAINLQTSFLTPPFGFALFYLRGVAPPSVTTMQIYKGVAPFVLIQILALVVLWYFPAIATWLPTVIF
ncbi:TRAP transporter large permease subunit [Alphaproteobacteria bacterium HT1-32]|nr:TRAP transporter large permease subunit [Alphaproteobacteria bacterium HT1-32]